MIELSVVTLSRNGWKIYATVPVNDTEPTPTFVKDGTPDPSLFRATYVRVFNRQLTVRICGVYG